MTRKLLGKKKSDLFFTCGNCGKRHDLPGPLVPITLQCSHCGSSIVRYSTDVLLKCVEPECPYTKSVSKEETVETRHWCSRSGNHIYTHFVSTVETESSLKDQTETEEMEDGANG